MFMKFNILNTRTKIATMSHNIKAAVRHLHIHLRKQFYENQSFAYTELDIFDAVSQKGSASRFRY